MYTLIRTGAFEGFADLVRELGVDPADVFREAQLDESLLQVNENLIPSGQFIHCLRLAAELTGRSDFGLLLSTRQKVTMLGPIGELAEACASIQDSIQVMSRFLRLHNSSAVAELQQYNGKVLLTYDDVAPGYTRDPQICDFAMGFSLNVARSTLGEQWTPKGVYFIHKRPKNLTLYETIFRCPLYFDQEVYGVEFKEDELNTPQPKADKIKSIYLMHYIERLQEEMQARETNASTVGYLIHSLLPSGECSESRVAELLLLNKRTLQRRLQDENTSFNELLRSIRLDLARQYLRETRISLTTLASYLGYSELSAFSRFFKLQEGCSPSEYRRYAV